MEAFERGECVEVRTDKTVAGQWRVTIDPLWDWNNNDYRIEPKPKQTVTIEKWLCKSGFSDYHSKVIEASVEFIKVHYAEEDKVKLLDTYEVGYDLFLQKQKDKRCQILQKNF